MSIATMKSIMCDITELNIARVNPQVTTFVFGFEGYFRKSTRSLRIVQGKGRKRPRILDFLALQRSNARKMAALMCSDIFHLIDFDLTIDIHLLSNIHFLQTG